MPIPYPNMPGQRPMSYPNMPGQPPMPYPNMPGQYPMPYPNMPGQYPYRRRLRCRRRCRSRPVIYVVRSDSCSSISTCSTISPCCKRRYRSCSYSRDHRAAPQQQQIILLPIKCQQTPGTTSTLQALPQQTTLPTIQFQNQPQSLITRTPLNITSAPIFLNNTGSITQPNINRSNTISFIKPQSIQTGSIQYVQAPPKSSSLLQLISVNPNAAAPSQHVLVNSTNDSQ